MKNLFFVLAIAIIVSSCGSNSSTENAATSDATSNATSEVKADSTVVVDSTAEGK